MIKRKNFIVASIAGLLALGSVAHAADIKERNLKIAAVLQADSPYVIAAQKFADTVSQKSGSKIKAKVFAGGSLGGDVAVISSLQGGTVDMTMVSAGLLSGLSKDFGVFSIPLLFSDAKQAYDVLDGPVGKKFLDLLPSKGLVGLGWWEYGFHNVTNSKRPVIKWEDIQGLKIRTQQIPVVIEAINALSANAVPMPFTELYTALESKAVDGQQNTLNTIEKANFYEVQKYVSTTRHIYDPIVVLFSKKVWDRLAEDERKVIQDAVAELTPYQRQLNQQAEVKALEALKSKGMTVTDFIPQERERMSEKLKPVTQKHMQNGDPTLMKELFVEIEKHRTGSK